MRTYYLYLLVQRALIQQVLDEIEFKYLTRLHHRLTRQVPSDIRALLFQLVQAYGKITPKNLRERYERWHQCDITFMSPSIIDTSVNDLHEIAEMVG